jgi:hypothetical protein
MTMISHRAAIIDALNEYERYAKDSAANWEQGSFEDHRRSERKMKDARAKVLAAFDAETARLRTPATSTDHAAD